MAVKSSGSLSLTTDIVGEFGGTAPHSLSEYYGGAGLVPAGANPSVATSGQTNMGSYYDAVAATVLTISSNTDNYDIGSAVTSAGGDKNTPVILTINSGVTVGSTSSGTAAMYTGTGWGSGVTINIINNGSIVGATGQDVNASTGGAGGSGGYGGCGWQGSNCGGGGSASGSGSSGSAGSGSADPLSNGGNAFEHSQTADNYLSVIFDTAGTRTGGSAGTTTIQGGGGGGGGASSGAGGARGSGSWWSGFNYQCPSSIHASAGSSGGATSGGGGGSGKSGSGAGGSGGSLGNNGSSGGSGGGYWGSGGSGGSAGTDGSASGTAGSALSGNTGQIS